MMGTVCFEEKLLFLMQNLGIWRIMGTGGQNMWSKVPYLESPTLISLFTMQLYGAAMMIKGSLLLSAPIVSVDAGPVAGALYCPQLVLSTQL